jgi:hypothetical protein
MLEKHNYLQSFFSTVKTQKHIILFIFDFNEIPFQDT